MVLMNGEIVMPKFNKPDFLKEWGLMNDTKSQTKGGR